MPMDSHYVGRHLCTRIGPRTCAEARGSEKGKFAIYNYKPALKLRLDMDVRLSFGILAAIGWRNRRPEVGRVR